ncbi:MAG: DegV family protein [Firmicutes bacterium]|nr:DegV family protein [Bacillota bacterium]
MSQIKIVTDSASDLPEHLLEKYDITMIPLTVMFNGIEYKDRVDLTMDEFYDKLVNGSDLPTTSQVNPEQYLEVFNKYLAEDREILVVGISLKLSGTLQSAQIAKDMLNSDKIHIFDSGSASLGEGLCVLKAAERVAAGDSIDQVLEHLTKHREIANGLIVLDSLQHLVRGGRLSRSQALLGSVLNIKPILSISNGEITVMEKVRSQKRALNVMIERIKELGVDLSQRTIGIAHTQCLDLANDFAELVRQEFQPKDIVIHIGGATIGTHVGTGGIGIFY